MELDLDDADTGAVYRTLSGAVVPRPTGWISTTSEAGVDNLAPYSFFNVVSVSPPVVMFAPVDELDALGRLAGSRYTHTRDRFSMERPP